MREIAVLFVRDDSFYHGMPGIDAYDRNRDARNWKGGVPLVAHPPCAQWGALRRFARVDSEQKAMGPFAVELVRRFGGVVEHPAWSTLWKEMAMPFPGDRYDTHGGWTLSVQQHWWGHKAAKATWLYIVGASPSDLPPVPIRLGDAPYVVGSKKRDRPEITKAEREHTPPLFAEWLVELARGTQVNHGN